MKKVIAVYSPLCEANAAFLGKLHEWLDTEVEIEECPYPIAADNYGAFLQRNGNCFIDVYYEGKCIDSVPLHREHLLSVLGLSNHEMKNDSYSDPVKRSYTEEEVIQLLQQGKIEFIPITKENYLDEMTMCLTNYPRGNPDPKYHKQCIDMKQSIFEEVFLKESIGGVYARSCHQVIGLLEVFPREIVKKYGYMTGTRGVDYEILTVGCYEVGYGIPRVWMLDELMRNLFLQKDSFQRRILEGVGILGWADGFNPDWVYEKYGFTRTEAKDEHTIVMTQTL